MRALWPIPLLDGAPGGVLLWIFFMAPSRDARCRRGARRSDRIGEEYERASLSKAGGASARRLPVVLGGQAAFGPYPLDLLIGECDLLVLGHSRELRGAVIGHSEVNGRDIGVGEADGEVLPFDARGARLPELELPLTDVLVVGEDAVEEGRYAIKLLHHNEGLVHPLARRAAARG